MAEGDGFCTFKNTNVHSQMSQVVSSSSDMFVYLLCTYLREKKFVIPSNLLQLILYINNLPKKEKLQKINRYLLYNYRFLKVTDTYFLKLYITTMLTFAIFGNFMFPNYVEKIRCFILAYFSISLEKIMF